LNVLISGGGLSESFLFHETLNIGVSEFLGSQNGSIYTPLLKISSSLNDTMNTTIVDGPFSGFLPGYDSLPFDLEDGIDGYYDVGQPLVSLFERAQELSGIISPTPEQEAEFDYAYSMIVFYLNDSGLSDTTLTQFLQNLDNDDLINRTSTNLFGLPVRGLALDSNQRPVNNAGAEFIETISMKVIDSGAPYDDYPFDSTVYDLQSDEIAFINVNSAPPIPSTGIPSGSYSAYTTDLEGFARVIRVGFKNPLSVTPTFYVWIQGSGAPTRVNALDRVDSHTYEFSISQPANFKLVVL
jgi:hypothetical protein